MWGLKQTILNRVKMLFPIFKMVLIFFKSVGKKMRHNVSRLGEVAEHKTSLVVQTFKLR